MNLSITQNNNNINIEQNQYLLIKKLKTLIYNTLQKTNRLITYTSKTNN